MRQRTQAASTKYWFISQLSGFSFLCNLLVIRCFYLSVQVSNYCPGLSVCLVLVTLVFSFGHCHDGNVSANTCVWYGQCGYNDDTPAKLNCMYEGEAPCLDETTEHFKLLAETCPMLISETVNETRACCDLAQVQTLHKSLALSEALLGGCPSCAFNFRQLFCYSTCSPNQLQFMRYTHDNKGRTTGVYPSGSTKTVAEKAQADSTCPLTTPDGDDEDKPSPAVQSDDAFLNYTSVYAVEYHMDKVQAVAFYDSCKNVQFSSSQTKVIGMLCGRSADLCSVEDFFSKSVVCSDCCEVLVIVCSSMLWRAERLVE